MLGDNQRMLGLLGAAPGVVTYFRRKNARCVSRNGPKSDRCHLEDESPNLSGIGLRCVLCNRPQHPKCIGTIPSTKFYSSSTINVLALCQPVRLVPFLQTRPPRICRSMPEMLGDMIESGSNYICGIMSELVTETCKLEKYNSPIDNRCYPLMHG